MPNSSGFEAYGNESAVKSAVRSELHALIDALTDDEAADLLTEWRETKST